ncbi:MAG: AsmA family protein [Porticoccaceae bacterium]
MVNVKKYVKWLAAGLLPLVTLFAVAILYVTFAVDINSYKSDIESLARQQGYELSIRGDLAWQFFPKPGVSIADVSISDQTSVSGSASRLVLATHWTQLFSLGGDIAQLELSTVKVEAGTLRWLPANGAAVQLNNIQLAIDNLSLQGKEFAIAASARAFGGRNFSLEADIAVLMDGQNVQQLSLMDLQLQLDSIRLFGELSASDNGAFVQGNLYSDSFDAKQLIASLQPVVPLLTVPNTLVKTALTDVSLKTSFSLDTQAASKINGELSLDGQSFDVDVTIDHLSNNLTTLISGDILRAGDYLPASNADSNNSSLFAPLAIPFALWQGRSQVEVNLSRVEFNDFSVANFYSNVFGNQRVLRMTSLNADLFGGQVNGIAKLDMRSSKPSFQLQPSLYNIDVAQAMEALGDESTMTGTLSLDANIQGSGLELGEITRSLSGAGKFQVQQPVYKAFNLEQSFCNAAALLSGRGQASKVWPADTQFDNLQGAFQLSDGKLLINNYSTGTGNLDIMGRGTIDLIKRQYRLNISARVDQPTSSATGCSINQRLQNRQIPFVCSGAFDQSNAPGLSCKPDERLIKDLVKDSALEKLLGTSRLQSQGTKESAKGLIRELLKR